MKSLFPPFQIDLAKPWPFPKPLPEPNWPPRPKPKRKRKPVVTIIVGVVCNNGIVIASDSQITEDTRRRTDAEKIKRVVYQNGEGLIAQAGDADWSTLVCEHVIDEAADCQIDDKWGLAHLVDGETAKVQRRFMEGFDVLGPKAEDFKSIFEQHSFSLMLGHYYEQEPRLYSMHYPGGLCTPQKNFVTLGCGKDIADYLLSRLYSPQMDHWTAAITAIYVLGEVIKIDAACSHPIKLGIVRPDGTVRIAEPDLISRATAEWAEHERDIDRKWIIEVARVNIGILEKSLGTGGKPPS